MTFWPLTNSDFPTEQTFHQFHDLYTELELHRIMSGFHGAFATGVARQQETLTLPDTWFRPPFWDLLMLQLLRPNSSNLPCLYSTFHLEYPLVLSRFCILNKQLYLMVVNQQQRSGFVIRHRILSHKKVQNKTAKYPHPKKTRKKHNEDKKEEIWLSPMTKAPTPTEMSKGQWQHKQRHKKVRLNSGCGPT